MSDAFVRILGALFILQGLVRLGLIANTVIRARALPTDPYYLVVFPILPSAIAVLTIIAGISMVALMRSGRSFALAICGIALAYQLYGFISTLLLLYVVAPATARSLGTLFWALQPAYMALFLAGLIVLLRWRPPAMAPR